VAGVCPRRHGATVKPDLVIVAYDTNNIVTNLRALGIQVLEQDAATSVSDALAQIRQLGTATGHAAAAQRVAVNVQRDITAAIASVSAAAQRTKVSRSSISVYYELDPTLYSITSGTFVGSLLSSLGVTNIADAVATEGDYGYPQLSREYIVSASPKIIFLADTKCCSVNATMVAKRTGFGSVRAVAFHHVVALDDDVASRWGPRLGTLMRQIAAAVNKALAQKSWVK
jgi:iron complex transport system substrate-binding protein